ncbi:GLUG motif-containing protein [Achromobacter pestifer]|uniref:Filamentous haemagglutinin FhaB/tRNA nuclease CdiA-like TPS domain-containing protein n=1 Tax=Achromobacter pestifer TaxID=1353889 RepID=A0A6S6YJ01_9BURK|nr:GLUG motif-containing protein [Achromobacter pestifer]CAB3624950.1 hypothetical protein LMG3431_00090 [Achromobacter pestifer]
MNKSYAVVWNESKGCWIVAGETAKRRGKSSCSGVRAGAMAAVVLGLSALMPTAHALPEFGSVTHGGADIWTAGSEMVINQTKPKTVIEWENFGVEHRERLTFNQGASDMLLNYVKGDNQTAINGSINAAGKIFIVNPRGIVFNAGANVNVGGLVASTRRTDRESFSKNTSGEFVFQDVNTNRVENNGALISSHSGSVVLLGNQVINRGVIQANGGTVALGAGDNITVRMGSGLVNLQINAAAAHALVQNTGTIRADGGQVMLQAKHANASSPLTTVINNSGVIEAKTLNNVPGKIVLEGGTSGAVEVGGRLSATALTSYGNGGAVEASGENVIVRLGTNIDTRAINGQTGTFKVTSNRVNVEDTAVVANPTIHADTLNRNLGNTNVELASTLGDVVVNAPVKWSSGNDLILNAQHGGQGKTVLNGALTATGSGATLSLKADEHLEIGDRILLSGHNSRVSLETTTAAPGTGGSTGKPATANYVLKNPNANITQSGVGATFLSNNIYHNIIQNQAGLQAVNKNLSGFYVLGADLRGTGTFRSIGGAYGTFDGLFDGLGHTLTGFAVSSGGSNVGLFSSSAGVIRNLNLTGMNVTSPNVNFATMSIGALAGYNTGMIDNVNVTKSTVNGNNFRANVTGGLVGTNLRGTVSNSSFSGAVRSGSYTNTMGGLVGANLTDGQILNSKTSGTVSGALQRNDLGGIGGLVGANNGGTIRDARSASAVTASSGYLNAGGLVGLNYNGELRNVSSTGALSTSKYTNAGGLVGTNTNGEIVQGASSGQVRSSTGGSIGGLVGVNNGGAISESAASGNVSNYSGANTGGLIGANNNGKIKNVKASGAVEDRAYSANIGGLVGSNGMGSLIEDGEASGATVVSVYATSGTRMGGLVGSNNGTIAYSASRVGKVHAGNYATVGGLVGQNTGGILASSTTSQTQGGQYSIAGGLAGVNAGTISAGVATGAVTGNHYATIGGLVAQNQMGGKIEFSTASGRIGGQLPGSNYYYGTGMTLGGLVAVNQGQVNYSSSSSEVNFRNGLNQTFGGLVGINYGGMRGNAVFGHAGLVPLAGTNYGMIDMSN